MAGTSAPDDEHRCTWVRNNGRRCKQPRALDDADDTRTWCPFHRRMQEERSRRWALAQEVEDLPVEEHLRMQLRMAYVMCRASELEVMDLGLDRTAFLMDTKETESRDGGPGGGYVSVKRARLMGAHPLLLQYLREREMYLNVVKTCVAAGLAARQVQAIERYVEGVLWFAQRLADELGHDPNDPGTRAVMMRTLQEMESQVRSGLGEGVPRGDEGGGRALGQG